MDLSKIKKHWNRMGAEFDKTSSVTPTSRDPFLGMLEKQNILRYLKSDFAVLEIGCGDASHTVEYAKHVDHIIAIDVAETLVERAQLTAATASCGNVEFKVCSVLEMEDLFELRQFDCIISQRCLINLPQWNYQKEAIGQLHRLLDDDGLFLLTEGFQKELDRLNVLRQSLGLNEIRAVQYNRNIIRTKFERFIADFFDIVELRDYGLYLLLSRVFHPLAILPDEPKHDSPLNEAAMKMASLVSSREFQEYSYNLFYALKKK
jgi:SAM-dependent methyltransferase